MLVILTLHGAETFTVDHWRCRFRAVNRTAASGLPTAVPFKTFLDIQAIMQQRGLDVVKSGTWRKFGTLFPHTHNVCLYHVPHRVSMNPVNSLMGPTINPQRASTTSPTARLRRLASRLGRVNECDA